MKINNDNNFSTLPNNINNNRQKIIGEESCGLFNKKFDLAILKKGLIILGLSFILVRCTSEKEDCIPRISINSSFTDEDISYFAEYSFGKVYICKSDDFIRYNSLLEENDILVIDKRDGSNPDMCIYKSCEINEVQTIVEVLMILEEYERRNPTQWNRTFKSMYNEWLVHNIFYKVNIKTNSTAHVDLDNEDEGLFNSSILSKILKCNICD